MAKRRKEHKPQIERIDTSGFTDDELAKYALDDEGSPVQQQCVVCGGWFLMRRYKRKPTCCSRCTLCFKHGGPDYDYDVALAWKYEQQRLSYHAKTGYDNPSQNPYVKRKVGEAFDRHYGDGTPGSGRVNHFQSALRHYQEETGYVNPSQDPEVRVKVNSTLAEHYGDGDLDKANKVLYARRAKTYRGKTGYENPGENPDVRAKVHDTVMDRYGVDNVFQSDDVKDKIVSTNLERYGVRHLMQDPDVLAERSKVVMGRYGVPYYVMLTDVQRHSGAISRLNLGFKSRLEETLTGVGLEEQFGGVFKADISIRDKGVLVDLNPTISHNSTIGYRCFKGLCDKGRGIGVDHSSCGGAKASDYHRRRYESAYADGWRLIQFYDWDDTNRCINCIINVVDDVFIDVRNSRVRVIVPETSGDDVNVLGRSCAEDAMSYVSVDDVRRFITEHSIHSFDGDAFDSTGWLAFCDVGSCGIDAVCRYVIGDDGRSMMVRGFVTRNQMPLVGVVDGLLGLVSGDASCGVEGDASYGRFHGVDRVIVDCDLDLNLPSLDDVLYSADGAVVEYVDSLVWAFPVSRRGAPIRDDSLRMDGDDDYRPRVDAVVRDGMVRVYTAGYARVVVPVH